MGGEGDWLDKNAVKYYVKFYKKTPERSGARVSPGVLIYVIFRQGCFLSVNILPIAFSDTYRREERGLLLPFFRRRSGIGAARQVCRRFFSSPAASPSW